MVAEQADLDHRAAVEILYDDAQWDAPALGQRASTEDGQQSGTDREDDVGSSHAGRKRSGRETDLAEHPCRPRRVGWDVVTEATHRHLCVPLVLSPGAVTFRDPPLGVVRVRGDDLHVVVACQSAGHARCVGRDAGVLWGVI